MYTAEERLYIAIQLHFAQETDHKAVKGITAQILSEQWRNLDLEEQRVYHRLYLLLQTFGFFCSTTNAYWQEDDRDAQDTWVNENGFFKFPQELLDFIGLQTPSKMYLVPKKKGQVLLISESEMDSYLEGKKE